MKQLAALAYADWCAMRNDARLVVRSPRRIGLWLVYAAAVGMLVFIRLHGRPDRSATEIALVARADYLVCAVLVTLVVSLAAGRGAVGIFRSRVEARFIIGSPVAAPLAIAYLQARATLGLGLRFIFSLVYFIAIFAPRRVGAGMALMDLLLALAFITAGASLVVPRGLLSARAGVVCMLAGIPLGLLAIAPAVRDAVQQLSSAGPLADAVLALVPAWHPGRVLLERNSGWLGAVVALAVAAIATLAGAFRDTYPELYALSIARLERTERRRGQDEEVRSAGLRGGMLRRGVPSGVLVFVWKSVVEFRRTVRPVYIVGGVALCATGGFAIAHAIEVQGPLFGTLLGIVVNVIVITGIGSTALLAGELRRPLFWLSPAAVFERLCALALAHIWRALVVLEIVAAGFALGGGSVQHTLVLAVTLPILVALLAGIGFITFALFPSFADQRGPGTGLRFVLSALMLVPPLVVYGVGADALHAPRTALFGASLLMLIEAGALIGIAAWRLDGQTDRLALAG